MGSEFWVGLAQIMMINLVLSGDNAVVIALACRNLPLKQRKLGIFWGTVGAVVFRIVLTFFAVWLLQFKYLQIIGGLLLLWIAIKLLIEDEGEEEVEAGSSFWAAMKTIIFADVIMSLDNVLGIAAVARDNLLLLIVGLAISIPIVIFGSTLILRLMDRFPIIIYIGAGILGYVAGEMFVGDKAVAELMHHYAALHTILPWAGAAFVILLGYILKSRKAKEAGEPAKAAKNFPTSS